MRSRKAITWAIVAVVLCAVVGVVAAARRVGPSTSPTDVPTGRVKRGDLDMKVLVTGELKARHSEMLAAPPIGGGALQITRLLHTGSVVKKGDLVMEFDPSEQHYKLDQNRSELLQAEQEITKAKADAAVTTAQDRVALLKARFDVRRAELEVQKNELVSTIDARKNQLTLEGAQRVLTELEQDVKSRTASNQPTISLAEEKRKKAKLAMEQAQGNIDKMRVVAPMDGLVALEKTRAKGFSSAGCRCRNIARAIKLRRAERSAKSSIRAQWTSLPKWVNLSGIVLKKDSPPISSSTRCPEPYFTAL